MGKITKNLVWGFTGQLLILALSIILPRFILISFGSEVNGVAATITQIFSYIALLEAGIGNASINRLYKDISDNSRAEISKTVSATKRYFDRIIPIYIICVIIFGIVYPMIIVTEVPSHTIRLIILIQGLSGVVNFYFTQTYTQLLVADGRTYVTSNLSLMVKMLSTGLQIALILFGFDIASVQLSLLVAYILKALILNIYIRRKYPWLQKIKKAELGRLEQRGYFVIHEISTAVFQGSDIFLVSAFCSLKETSVYSVYNMVFVALNSIISIFFRGFDFKLGVEYNRDKENYIKLHDTYETIVSCFAFTVISAAVVVILPFIRLYTSGVDDINYIVPILPILLAMVQLLSFTRMVAAKLISVSGKTKDTVINSILETIINIIASIICVRLFGISGVVLGTIIALLYRTNDMLIYANVKILKRKPLYAYKVMFINFGIFAGVVWFVNAFPVSANDYLQFFIYGVISFIIMAVLYFGIHAIVTPNVRRFLLDVLCKLKKRSSNDKDVIHN